MLMSLTREVVEWVEAAARLPEPDLIHSAIRKQYALGADNELAQMFPLTNEEELPIFG